MNVRTLVWTVGCGSKSLLVCAALVGAAHSGVAAIAAVPSERITKPVPETAKADAALRSAAERGDLVRARGALSHGARLDAMDQDRDTALMLAVAAGRRNVARFLLDRGANVRHRNARGESALHYAMGHPCYTTIPDLEMVRLLLDRGANVNAMDLQGETPLSRAASGGHTAITRVLISRGAAVNAQSQYGMTALLAALRAGKAETARLLLLAGADITTRSTNSEAVLSLAAGSVDDPSLLRELIARGADANAPGGEFGFSPLFTAIMTRHKANAQVLLEAGAKIETGSNGEIPALASAVLAESWTDQPDLVVDLVKRLGSTKALAQALESSASVGLPHTVQALLDLGAPASGMSGDQAPILASVQMGGHGRARLAESAMRHGEGGWTEMTPADRNAMLSSARRGDAAIIRALLAKGADPNARNRYGVPALRTAAESGNVDAVEALIEGGATIEATDADGLTPLMRAAQNGEAVVVKLLLKHKANVNARTSGGATALELADGPRKAEIVALLTAAGGRIFAQDTPVTDGIHATIAELPMREVVALNNRGNVAGMADRGRRNRSGRPVLSGVIYSNGTLTDLGPGQVVDMNDAGQVVGLSEQPEDARVNQRAYLWSKGRRTSLPAEFRPVALSNRGEIIGHRNGKPAIWRAGRITVLNSLPVPGCEAQDINDRGAVVLYSYNARTPSVAWYLWQNGRSRKLEAAGQPFRPASLEDNGDMAGEVSVNKATFAVVVRGGKYERLPAPEESEHAGASGVNAAGTVVGYGIRPFPSEAAQPWRLGMDPVDVRKLTRAVLWRHGTPKDLNGLLAENSGWHLAEARFINDQGEIVGSGLRYGVDKCYILKLAR